jgi:putative ABC transport system permease protein
MVPGVDQVVYANWFGGVYIDKRHFFPRIAVGPENYFDIFPEFIVSKGELEAYWKQRNACIAGQRPQSFTDGNLEIRIRSLETYTLESGVSCCAESTTARPNPTDETIFFFHWDYLDETLKKSVPRRAGQVGWYVIQVRNPADAGQISEAVDDLFKNSSAETPTETEKAFQAGFLAMTEAIVGPCGLYHMW